VESLIVLVTTMLMIICYCYKVCLVVYDIAESMQAVFLLSYCTFQCFDAILSDRIHKMAPTVRAVPRDSVRLIVLRTI